jgi:hypothetical protein
MDSLADDLIRLREALLPQARDAAAIGAIASAEIAAKAGDPSRVNQALSALGTAGKWVFGVAKDIGVQIAVETLKKTIGM